MLSYKTMILEELCLDSLLLRQATAAQDLGGGRGGVGGKTDIKQLVPITI